MKSFFGFLFIALILTGCKKPILLSQPNVPAKYSLTIGITSVETSLDEKRINEVFELLTEQAVSNGIICQSIVKSPQNNQLTFNIISQLTQNGEQDPGLDYFTNILSHKPTLGFWDVYRNNDEPVREVLLHLYEKYKLAERLPLTFSIFNSDLVYASAVLAEVTPENIPFLDSLFHLPEVVKTFPEDMILAWSFYPVINQEGKSYFDLFALKKSTKLGPYITGKDLQAINSNREIGAKSVDIVLDLKFDAVWILKEKSRWAAENSKREIGIVVNGRVVIAPRVINEIPNGRAVITGNFDFESASQMINKIKLSAIPFEIKVLEAKKL